MKILDKKNIIITGASRGLGLHIARAMWRHAANLLLVARSEESLFEVRKELAANSFSQQVIHYVSVDLRTSDAIERILAKARSVWDRLDGLVNNAGVQGPIGKAWDTDWNEWLESISLNLIAQVHLCRACIPWMKEHKQGKIITISGGGATGLRPNFTAYAVAKTGVVRFSEILAEEVRDLNIHVNCIAPGALNTDMFKVILSAGPEKVGEEEYVRILKQKESGGASPERAAELCVFLASPASDGITGKLISAAWDPWEDLPEYLDDLQQTDIYTLRRVVPQDRGKDWGDVKTLREIEGPISASEGTRLRVGVIGMWHLGAVVAGCLAQAGYEVEAYDSNTKTIQLLCDGGVHVDEPGLKELLRKGEMAGLLRFTSDPAAISESDVIWVAYDTPVDEGDQSDINFVLSNVEALFPHLKDGQLVIISSQLPVGTTSQLEMRLQQTRPDLSATFACLPENLQLGKAIEAFTKPERVVAGVRTEKDKTRIARLLAPFTDNIIWMSFESAEMTKHAINAFLAASVSFINELARICEWNRADAAEVERGLKSDVRIGSRAYLRPGPAFAGGTLARDLNFLLSLGREKELELPLLRGAVESNDLQKSWPREKLLDVLGEFQGKKVALLGLTYKPGTDTLRRSESVEIGRWLNSQGAKVAAYDPVVTSLPNELENVLELSGTLGEVLEGAQAALVATPWPEFKRLKADEVVARMERPAVIDPGGFLSDVFERDPRILYLKVGKSYETRG